MRNEPAGIGVMRMTARSCAARWSGDNSRNANARKFMGKKLVVKDEIGIFLPPIFYPPMVQRTMTGKCAAGISITRTRHYYCAVKWSIFKNVAATAWMAVRLVAQVSRPARWSSAAARRSSGELRYGNAPATHGLGTRKNGHGFIETALMRPAARRVQNELHRLRLCGSSP